MLGVELKPGVRQQHVGDVERLSSVAGLDSRMKT